MSSAWDLVRVVSLMERSNLTTRELAAVMTRVALKDFTFSDGTFVPKGTMVSAAAQSIHLDSDYYENGDVFDPWRFSSMRDEEGESVKHQLVATNVEYIAFGHGRHAW